MKRDEMVAALLDIGPGKDVQVNVAGFLVDVTMLAFDRRRDSIVIHLFAEDVAEIIRRAHPAECACQGVSAFIVTGPAHRGSGNSN